MTPSCSDVCEEVDHRLRALGFQISSEGEDHTDMMEALDKVTLVKDGAPSFSQLELDFIQALAGEEVAYWQSNMESEAHRGTAVMAATIANKLEGMDFDDAELEARRQVDDWWNELQAPGGA